MTEKISENYRARMERKLTAAFSPILLEIKDDSQKHAGHAGASPKGETHFSIRIVSSAFDGQSRVARHRAVYATLAAELNERVHALVLNTISSTEYNH